MRREENQTTECPRCGASIQPFLLLGLDVVPRRSFSLAAALALLPFDIGIGAVSWYLLHDPLAVVLWVFLGPGPFRYALAYTLIWRSAIHAGHGGRRSWRDTFVLGIAVPLTSSTTFCFWLAAHILARVTL